MCPGSILEDCYEGLHLQSECSLYIESDGRETYAQVIDPRSPFGTPFVALATPLL